MPVLTNWSRWWISSPAGFAQPTSEDQVIALIRRAASAGQQVRVTGATHSWSDGPATSGISLSLDGLSRVLAIDRAAGTVTVQAGIRLFQLNQRLASEGLALPVVGSIDRQSVAGAISTATHGSAPRLGNLASGVRALRLVCADGSVKALSREREPELFSAARVSLGALGVITEVTLRVVPAFDLEEIAEPLPLEEALARIPALVESEPFVKLWWLPHTGRALVSRCRPTTARRTFSPLARWIDAHLVNAWVFRFLLFLGAVLPALTPPIMRLVRLAYFVPRRTVGRSDLLLTVPMPPVHQESEYALPIEAAAEAVRRLAEVIERERINVDFVCELRFVAADDALLSPDQGRQSCRLGCYLARRRDVPRLFAAFEQEMLALGGRPHWGKLFSASPDTLRAAVPGLARFDELRRALDPKGMFANGYVRRIFGA